MSKHSGHHESLEHRDNEAVGSDRSFGLVFAAVFALVGLFKLWRGGDLAWVWLAAAGAMLAVAVLRPGVLRLFNRLWFQFGKLLARVVNPVIMGVLLFGVITPIGGVMRLCGCRPLSLTFDPAAKSYWVDRTAGPKRGSLRNPF